MQILIFMYKKTSSRTLITIFIIAITALLGTSSYLFFKTSHKKSEEKHKKTSYLIDCTGYDIPDSVKISPTKVLKDRNPVHLAYASLVGIKKPFISNQEFEEECDDAVKEKILVEIDNNPLFYVKELKYSHPYVVPEMGDLLNEIAYRFKKNLPKEKKEDFRFVVTSALRTTETQQDLSKYNRNASQNSAHLFGATVDISYKDVFSIKRDTLVQDWQAVEALTKTMQELRNECRLVTVRERHQSCFHTTVVVCKQ